MVVGDREEIEVRAKRARRYGSLSTGTGGCGPDARACFRLISRMRLAVAGNEWDNV